MFKISYLYSIEISEDFIKLFSLFDKIYRFTKQSKLIYLFSTKNRKREGQLLKLINKYIFKTNLEEVILRPSIKSLLKKDFYEKIKRLEKNKRIKNIII